MRLEVGSTGKGKDWWGVGVSLKKIQAAPKLGCLGGLGLLQPKRNQKIKSSLGRPEPSGVKGGGRSRGWGAVWQLGEGTALPLLGSPQPLRSGRKGAAGNPHRQVSGCQMLQAGGWREAHKGLPSREMTALPPSFSARVQRSLTSS